MHSITDAYLSIAAQLSASLGPSTVAALHLPPAPGRKDAEFCALELDDGSIGFSYIKLQGTEARLRARYGDNGVSGMPAAGLAQQLGSTDAVTKTLAFAAINALSQQLFSRAQWQPPTSIDPLGHIDAQPNEHIGMIGLFPPLLPEIKKSGARLTVLELRQSLVRDEDNVRVTLDPAELGSCEKVVSTCTVMLNDTLDDVLARCRAAKRFVIVGPTAGCVPDPLFARGVHAVGGRRVVDRDRFLAAFCAGKKWSAHANKYVLTADNYPGLDELMARIN